MKYLLRAADQNLKRWANQLGALGDGQAKRIMADALNKSGDLARTQVKRSLVRITGIKYGQVNKAVATHRATTSSLSYALVGKGDETNLNLFAARQGAKGVSAAPWNTRRIFPSTFQIPRYGRKVFHRVGSASDKTYGKLQDHNLAAGANTRSGAKGFGRFPIKQVYGPNIGREMGRDGEPKQHFAAVTFTLGNQIDKQIARYLK